MVSCAILVLFLNSWLVSVSFVFRTLRMGNAVGVLGSNIALSLDSTSLAERVCISFSDSVISSKWLTVG